MSSSDESNVEAQQNEPTPPVGPSGVATLFCKNKKRILVTVIAILILIIVILAIVLPITLAKKSVCQLSDYRVTDQEGHLAIDGNKIAMVNTSSYIYFYEKGFYGSPIVLCPTGY